MERLLHRGGPAVPIFGSPRSEGTSYLWASGGAVKKRLLRRAGPAAAIFGLVMAIAHMGPTTLWIAVVKVAVALGIFAERWRSPAGQRWRSWSSRPTSLAASPDDLSSLWLVSMTYILGVPSQVCRDQRTVPAERVLPGQRPRRLPSGNA
jgi:hypothetical protein